MLSLNSTDKTPAENHRDAMLARSAWPRMEPQTSVSTGRQQGGGDPTVEISVSGWFYALDWLVTSSSSTTLTASDVPAESPSAHLTAYPSGAPLVVRSAAVEVRVGGAPAPETRADRGAARHPALAGPMAALGDDRTRGMPARVLAV